MTTNDNKPTVHMMPGHKLTRRYRYDGSHILIVMEDGEAINTGLFRANRRRLRDTSKYQPHQGARECARRLRQQNAAEWRAVLTP